MKPDITVNIPLEEWHSIQRQLAQAREIISTVTANPPANVILIDTRTSPHDFFVEEKKYRFPKIVGDEELIAKYLTEDWNVLEKKLSDLGEIIKPIKKSKPFWK